MSDIGFSFLNGLRKLFYIVHPNEMEFKSMAELPPYVELAVPFFVFLSILEYCVGKSRGIETYEWKDTLMSFSLGAFQQLFTGLFGQYLLAPYLFLYENYRVCDVPLSGWPSFIATLLAADLGYYWFHRMAHEWHIVWVGHSVHHSGQRYNLATALRQGATQCLFSWTTYLPMAILGFAPAQFVAHGQLNLLYQFWVHTEMVGHLGPLELILNTPSHHRMHHRPPGNCNYAGVLIIWDRMFGTFVGEDRQVRSYGLAKPLTSYNPVYANLSHLHRMVGSGTGKGWGQLLSRRWPHPTYFNPMKLFQFDWRATKSLWEVDTNRDEKVARETHKTFMVGMYHGATFGGYAMPVHILLHWLLTFVASFYCFSKKEALQDWYYVAFLVASASYFTLGALCSELTLSNLRNEALRVGALLIALAYLIQMHWVQLAADTTTKALAIGVPTTLAVVFGAAYRESCSTFASKKSS